MAKPREVVWTIVQIVIERTLASSFYRSRFLNESLILARFENDCDISSCKFSSRNLAVNVGHLVNLLTGGRPNPFSPVAKNFPMIFSRSKDKERIEFDEEGGREGDSCLEQWMIATFSTKRCPYWIGHRFAADKWQPVSRQKARDEGDSWGRKGGKWALAEDRGSGGEKDWAYKWSGESAALVLVRIRDKANEG